MLDVNLRKKLFLLCRVSCGRQSRKAALLSCHERDTVWGGALNGFGEGGKGRGGHHEVTVKTRNGCSNRAKNP